MLHQNLHCYNPHFASRLERSLNVVVVAAAVDVSFVVVAVAVVVVVVVCFEG